MTDQQIDTLRAAVADVLLLNDNGTQDAPTEMMVHRCRSIIERECIKLEIDAPIFIGFVSIHKIPQSEEVRDWFLNELSNSKDKGPKDENL